MTAAPQNTEHTPLSVLVVDDEANIRKMLSMVLEADGHTTAQAGSAEEAFAAISAGNFDLAFVDLRLGTDSGLDVLDRIKAEFPSLNVVIITAYASVDTAVEALRKGADDYLQKPFTPSQVTMTVRKVCEVEALERRVKDLEERSEASQGPKAELASESPGMAQALNLARQVAPSEAIVLLRGESGTGKTMMARFIHDWSPRARKSFATVSCPSLSAELLESELFGHVRGAFTGAQRENPGRIAVANGGTLFLDEIGDLPLTMQPKLLRFIQDREYERVGDTTTRRADVRIIAATNIDLEQAVAEGRFREDLFYRLNVIEIELPPLRERREDLLALAESLLQHFARQYHKKIRGFSDDARRVVLTHRWPGNVRELRNAIERAVLLSTGNDVAAEHLPLRTKQAAEVPSIGDMISLDKMEEFHIKRVLEATDSLEEAARVLEIDPTTLWRRRKKYGI